jgi:hypothetical protein
MYLKLYFWFYKKYHLATLRARHSTSTEVSEAYVETKQVTASVSNKFHLDRYVHTLKLCKPFSMNAAVLRKQLHTGLPDGIFSNQIFKFGYI